MLSLSGDHAEAQAMTNEHIENLENTNTDATLWILAYRSQGEKESPSQHDIDNTKIEKKADNIHAVNMSKDK